MDTIEFEDDNHESRPLAHYARMILCYLEGRSSRLETDEEIRLFNEFFDKAQKHQVGKSDITKYAIDFNVNPKVLEYLIDTVLKEGPRILSKGPDQNSAVLKSICGEISIRTRRRLRIEPVSTKDSSSSFTAKLKNVFSLDATEDPELELIKAIVDMNYTRALNLMNDSLGLLFSFAGDPYSPEGLALRSISPNAWFDLLRAHHRLDRHTPVHVLERLGLTKCIRDLPDDKSNNGDRNLQSIFAPGCRQVPKLGLDYYDGYCDNAHVEYEPDFDLDHTTLID